MIFLYESEVFCWGHISFIEFRNQELAHRPLLLTPAYSECNDVFLPWAPPPEPPFIHFPELPGNDIFFYHLWVAFINTGLN